MDKFDRYGVKFMAAENDDDFVVTEPWIFYGVVCHAYFDSQDKIRCNGFLEDDPDLLENAKDNNDIINIGQQEHRQNWLGEDDSVLSFRYKSNVDKDEDTIYMKIIKLQTAGGKDQIQVNLISKKNDDEIITYEFNLPDDLNLLMDVPNLIKNSKVKADLEKLVSKFVPKKKKSLLISENKPSMHPAMPGRPGIPVHSPSVGGVGGGGFQPIGGPHDLGPFGGTNLIGPKSGVFAPKGSGPHGLIDDDDDDNLGFKPGPYGMGATPDNDMFPDLGGKKGGPGGGFGPGGFGPGGGFGSGGGFGGGFSGSGGTSGGNFYM